MAAPPKPLHPEILYAERSSETDPEKNIIYLTINVSDINGQPRLDITKDQISFEATSGTPDKGIPTKEWAFDLELWGEIVPEETKKVVHGRAVVLVLRKKELRAEYWPRLTKEKPNRSGWIKTDFSKWVDEDEQEGEDFSEVNDMGGMGGGMPGMPGMGGAGGMDMASMMAGMGGGAGGPGGGMDFASMMAGMGGAGGAGGAGGVPDMAKLMEMMGQSGGIPGGDGLDEELGIEEQMRADVAEGQAISIGEPGEPTVEEVE